MSKYKYGCQMHSTYEYNCRGESLLVFLFASFRGMHVDDQWTQF